jgi:hypothetical protein
MDLSLLVPLLTLAVLPLADRLERWALSGHAPAAELGQTPSSASNRPDRISLTNSA